MTPLTDRPTKKQRLHAQAMAALHKAKVSFETKNNGAHLIVYSTFSVIDFWPGTGKWAVRLSHRKGNGLQSLLHLIKAEEDIFRNDVCQNCDDEGFIYEGGMSANPEIDNRVPCPECNISRADI
ncbi:hypothetical protein GCM10023116_13400 [Kistimonas scapharcae]|uniref:Uncharacterized protein n=1 Tax=Kistimonas scapharcae TaxID=1036133 RepID=A0ABP8UZV5_9GAMM